MEKKNSQKKYCLVYSTVDLRPFVKVRAVYCDYYVISKDDLARLDDVPHTVLDEIDPQNFDRFVEQILRVSNKLRIVDNFTIFRFPRLNFLRQSKNYYVFCHGRFKVIVKKDLFQYFTDL